MQGLVVCFRLSKPLQEPPKGMEAHNISGAPLSFIFIGRDIKRHQTSIETELSPQDPKQEDKLYNAYSQPSSSDIPLRSHLSAPSPETKHVLLDAVLM